MYIITGTAIHPPRITLFCHKEYDPTVKHSLCLSVSEDRARKFETYHEADIWLYELKKRVADAGFTIEFKSTIVGGKDHHDKLLEAGNRI